MLRNLEAVQYIRKIGSGKTEPAIIVGETAEGEAIEVVAKLASACERKGNALANEVIGACLAYSLGLPIPEPFILSISPEWKATLPLEYASKVTAGDTLAFGSKLVWPQWPTWTQGHLISEKMTQTAAGIFAFDAFVDNVDRRQDNSNCLVSGDELRIFDHELAWPPALLFAKKPWVLDGLSSISQPGNHIFRQDLRARPIDTKAIRDVWAGLQDSDISAYGAAVPAEWKDAAFVDGVLQQIRDVRDNIDGCMTEFERVLK